MRPGPTGPQDSPGAARINREARTRRQGAPSKGGVAGTTMAPTGVPGSLQAPQVLSWEAECRRTSPPSEWR